MSGKSVIKRIGFISFRLSDSNVYIRLCVGVFQLDFSQKKKKKYIINLPNKNSFVSIYSDCSLRLFIFTSVFSRCRFAVSHLF